MINSNFPAGQDNIDDIPDTDRYAEEINEMVDEYTELEMAERLRSKGWCVMSPVVKNQLLNLSNDIDRNIKSVMSKKYGKAE